MEVTRLSSEGQVVIPKALRTAHHWEAGQELIAIDVGDGISKAKKTLSRDNLSAGCRLLEISGKTEKFRGTRRCDSPRSE